MCRRSSASSRVLRVRSGPICFQLIPPSMVFQSTLVAVEERLAVSTSEKTIGCVRTLAADDGLPGGAATASSAQRVRRSTPARCGGRSS